MKVYNTNEFNHGSYTEKTVNEGPFGFGESVEKPKESLTADFIREHTPEEIAELWAKQVAYHMSNVKNDVSAAIEKLNEGLKDSWSELKENVELGTKLIKGIGISIKNSITNKYEFLKKSVAAIPNALVFGVSYLVKLGVSGFDAAKQEIKKLYEDIANFMKKTYEEVSNAFAKAGEKVAQVFKSLEDKIVIFAKVSASIIVLVSNKVSGAAEAFGEWIKEMFNAAKENATFAVMVVKDWIASKTQEIKGYISNAAKDVADGVMKTWDAFSKDVKKVWTAVSDKIDGWMNDVKVAMDKIGQKISDVAKAAGEKLISIKDAGASTVIKKGVKALNKNNYSLDDVIDMVTKAYNESVFTNNGELMLNESLFNYNIEMMML